MISTQSVYGITTVARMLFDALSRYAVEGPHYFDDDAYTDMPEKELVAEVIREKALLCSCGMRSRTASPLWWNVSKSAPDTDLDRY